MPIRYPTPFRPLILASAALVLAVLAGCAGTSSGGPARAGSGVEVFGTIDAGVSRTNNKSGR